MYAQVLAQLHAIEKATKSAVKTTFTRLMLSIDNTHDKPLDCGNKICTIKTNKSNNRQGHKEFMQ